MVFDQKVGYTLKFLKLISHIFKNIYKIFQEIIFFLINSSVFTLESIM